MATEHAPTQPTRGAIAGALLLVPVLLALTCGEVILTVADTLDDLGAHTGRFSGPLWLGIYAVLGIAGPVSAGIAAWHTRFEGRTWWEVVLRAEMAFLLVGMPAVFLLFTF